MFKGDRVGPSRADGIKVQSNDNSNADVIV